MSKDEREYNILGTYRGNTERVDTATGEDEAAYLMAEYQLAYGSEWTVTYEAA